MLANEAFWLFLGVIVTAILAPLILRWFDRRQQKADVSGKMVETALSLADEIGSFGTEKADYWRARFEHCQEQHEGCGQLVHAMELELMRLRTEAEVDKK